MVSCCLQDDIENVRYKRSAESLGTGVLVQKDTKTRWIHFLIGEANPSIFEPLLLEVRGYSSFKLCGKILLPSIKPRETISNAPARSAGVDIFVANTYESEREGPCQE